MADLLPNQAHLWFMFTDHQPTTLETANWSAILSPEEQIQWKRFYFPKHQTAYLLHHTFLRLVLSKYAPLHPQEWQFKKNKYGRPDLDHPQYPNLYFNLSHTAGCVLCLVGTEPTLGADVENSSRTTSLDIADRYFAPPEYNALALLPEEKQIGRFFRYWTLKEAYIKARGMGLSIPLDDFYFTITHRNLTDISINFTSAIDDSPVLWQFTQHQLTPTHIAATAIRTPTKITILPQQLTTLPQSF